jgi:hypothetical protein
MDRPMPGSRLRRDDQLMNDAKSLPALDAAGDAVEILVTERLLQP